MNHPYFKHPYFTNRTPFINCNETDTATENENAITVPCTKSVANNYVPVVVDDMLRNPVWNDADPNHCEIIAGFFNRMSSADGYRVGKDSKIVSGPSAIYNGYISAKGLVLGDNGNIMYPTYIVNTEDAGLRMVSFDKNGYDPLDMGPVEDMMLVGNDARPEGLYVPLCNMKAVADAAVVIGRELERYEQGIINEELQSNITKMLNESHECKCGGNCQCGGACKCGGNCKCHHD